jgi:hypothetical protein
MEQMLVGCWQSREIPALRHPKSGNEEFRFKRLFRFIDFELKSRLRRWLCPTAFRLPWGFRLRRRNKHQRENEHSNSQWQAVEDFHF